MPDETFKVLTYSFPTLISMLERWTGNTKNRIEARPHSKYFETYFAELGAKTIVAEEKYVDNDFLQDYAGFYAQSFVSDGKECRRLHFFNFNFAEDDFHKLLAGRNEQLIEKMKVKDAYLGFIVVKPLPETFVGRTCLRTYSEKKNGLANVLRHFPIIRDYEASLYGLKLKVETLAFQEQDQTVAACATSALWSTFHGTGKLFQHSIPSPIEITQGATAGLPDYTRALPNDGLTLEQTAQAIRSIGLAPYWVDCSQESNLYTLKSNIYAYAKGKVPVLLVGEIFSTKRNMKLGLHAVAVTGYCYTEADPQPAPQTDFLLEASRIGKVYAHDDQVGPFARMEFRPGGHTFDKHTRDCLSTSFEDSSGLQQHAQFLPDCLLVPLDHSIRIPFGTIHDLIVNFDKTLEPIRAGQATTTMFAHIAFLQSRFRWEIYLTSINDFKSDVIKAGELKDDDRKNVLLHHLPRFMWRVTIFSGTSKLADLLFDTTGTRQGNLLVLMVEYDKMFCSWLRATARQLVPLAYVEQSEAWFLWKKIAEIT